MLPFVMLLPEDPIGHELMTESLTYPLFYLFIAETAKGIIWKKRKHLVWSFVICALQMWIRPQMLFCFAVLGVSGVYLEISERMKTGKKKGFRKNWAVRCVLCALCIFAGIKAVSGLTVVYEKVFFDAPALDYSDQTLVQRLLYLAQKRIRNCCRRADKSYLCRNLGTYGRKTDSAGLLWKQLEKLVRNVSGFWHK